MMPSSGLAWPRLSNEFATLSDQLPGMSGKRLSRQRAGLPKMLRLDADLFPRYVRGDWRPGGSG
jgi:hypothetical protein